MFLSRLPISPSIFPHCVARCATDETGIGSLSIFPGEATDSSPQSPWSAGSNQEMRTSPRSASTAEHCSPPVDRRLAVGAEAVLQTPQREPTLTLTPITAHLGPDPGVGPAFSDFALTHRRLMVRRACVTLRGSFWIAQIKSLLAPSLPAGRRCERRSCHPDG